MIRTRYDFSWSPRHTAAVVLLAAAWGGWLLAAGPAQPVRLGDRLPVDRDKVAAVAEKINPNVAPAASLRRLGGLGPVKAAAIAEFAARAGGKAFARAEDLETVEGIGPGTVERIRPFLSFGGQEK